MRKRVLAVPRVLRRGSVVNGLHWQTAFEAGFAPRRFSGEVANRNRRRHLQQAASPNANPSHRSNEHSGNLVHYLFCFQPIRIVVLAVRQLFFMRQAFAQMKIAQSSAFSAARRP